MPRLILELHARKGFLRAYAFAQSHQQHTCPLLSFRHHVFCLAFYFKQNYFILIDHILSETIYLFCVCVLFSDIYPKSKITAKNWFDLCTFYSKVIVLEFVTRKIFFLISFVVFLIIDVSQHYCENFREKK